MEKTPFFKDKDLVRHIETSRRGKITGDTIENGQSKKVVAWLDGRISYVSADRLIKM